MCILSFFAVDCLSLKYIAFCLNIKNISGRPTSLNLSESANFTKGGKEDVILLTTLNC